MNKPEAKHVTFYRNEGSYNWLNPKEKSAQYVFTFPQLTSDEIKEMGLIRSYLVDLEKDYSYEPDSYTALEAAYEIKSIYESYWIHSGLKDIEKLVEYLKSIEEEQEELRHRYAIENAKYQIYYWQQELEKLQG
ncbi:hypothetical protein [Robertmurraya siralis]|uniref:hypothetical protein n=1 Tax=Robertmurraya siralis TaxID=77777 RepID=UPI0010F4B8C6|nr:hypothetical protein [Robertmurraya siralis]